MEDLEPRLLLAGTSIGIYSDRPDAAETYGNSRGRGIFIAKRPTGSTVEPLTVQYYARWTGTATTADYKPLSGSVTIPAGKRSVAFNVYIVDDKLVEPSETLVLTLRKMGSVPIVHHSGIVTIADNDVAPPPPVVPADWWNADWHYRTSLSVNVGSTVRTDHVAEHSIYLSGVLSSLGRSGAVIEQSLRVVEVNADGTQVLDDNVPFQFDKADGYNASSNASGNLVLLLKGQTQADSTRYYHVYFDTSGSFSAPSFTTLVSVTDGVMDEGHDSLRISNQTATFYYQEAEGGFSSIVDSDGNDWISWSSTPGSAGEYRGTPNHGGVGFHPGRDHDINTAILWQGPLKATIESTDGQGNKVRWEFFPQFARETVVSMNQTYWFLYEGTPGGSISGGDTVVRSDGTVTASSASWVESNGLGAGNGEEWVYFRDSEVGNAGRYLFAVHNTPDNIVDSYWEMEGNMTVFGFGRDFNPFMTASNNVFTIGLADGGGDFAAAGQAINATWRGVAAVQGEATLNPA